jgi:hypothetical protein
MRTWITESDRYTEKSPSLRAIAHDFNELAQAAKDDLQPKRLLNRNGAIIREELIAGGVNLHDKNVKKSFAQFWNRVKNKMRDSDEYHRWLESSAEESRRMNAGATAIVPATGSAMPAVFSSAHQAFHAVGPFNAQQPMNLNSGTIVDNRTTNDNRVTNYYYGAAPTSNAAPSSALEQEDFANKVAEKVTTTLGKNINNIDSKLEATQQTLSEQGSLAKSVYEFVTTPGPVSPLSLLITIAMHTHIHIHTYYDDESHHFLPLPLEYFPTVAEETRWY